MARPAKKTARKKAVKKTAKKTARKGGRSSQPRRTKPSRSAQYDNTNSGALFRNENKIKSTHPDMQGKFTDQDGNEYWISAWSKRHPDYGKYLSIAATPIEQEGYEDDENEDWEEETDDLPF